MALSSAEIAETVYAQIARLERTGAALAHVKPHGALYNVAAQKPAVAAAIAEGVARWNPATVLVGLAGSQALEVWRACGFRVAAEAFADRRYEADGTLRSRQFADALIADPEEAAEQALRLVREGRAQTLCIHSDSRHDSTSACKTTADPEDTPDALDMAIDRFPPWDTDAIRPTPGQPRSPLRPCPGL